MGQSMQVFIEDSSFENFIYKISAILSKGEWMSDYV